MKLFGIYDGVIPRMQNTPCKIAIFTDGKKFKVFQKAFFRNNLNRPNWERNVIFESSNSYKLAESRILSLGFTKIV